VIRRHPLLDAFEEQQRRRPVNYKDSLRIYEGLWSEARALNAFPRPSLDGIEVDVEYARVINSLGPSRTDRSNAR
jgi:hypothetical protein